MIIDNIQWYGMIYEIAERPPFWTEDDGSVPTWWEEVDSSQKWVVFLVCNATWCLESLRNSLKLRCSFGIMVFELNKECLRKSAQVCRNAIYEVKWEMSVDVSWASSGKCLDRVGGQKRWNWTAYWAKVKSVACRSTDYEVKWQIPGETQWSIVVSWDMPGAGAPVMKPYGQARIMSV